MTEQKSLKRRVRARMSRTGERYTAARRQLLAREGSAVPPAPPSGMTADEVVRARTGRGWAEWFEILTAWGASERSHPEIARWLADEQGVRPWWTQQLTVGYEVAIGRRVVGQRGEAFSATASKTVAVPVARLYAAWIDSTQRKRWLPDAKLRLRTSQPERSARFDWDDGTSRVAVGFTAKGEGRSQVALEHERLADADEAERMKAFWRERVEALRKLLEA